jgi:recombination protein RecA
VKIFSGALALTLPVQQTPADLLHHEILTPLLPGLPRGAITEITGAVSSGRTSLLHSMLANATRQGEACAVVDANSSFDPTSADASGVDLKKLLWVQCDHYLNHAMQATDLILHAGGFGLVILDLCDMPAQPLQRIPTSYWYRFQRTVENTATVLLVLGAQPNARTTAARQIELSRLQPDWQGQPAHRLLSGSEVQATLRKPVSSVRLPLRAAASGE